MGPYSMGVQKYVFRKGYKVMKAGGLGGGSPQQDKYQNHHYY